MRVKLLLMKQLNKALKTATSSRCFSILSSDSCWEMCASANRTRSVRPGGKYVPFHSTHENFGNSKREFWSNGKRTQIAALNIDEDGGLFCGGFGKKSVSITLKAVIAYPGF